MNTNVKAVDGLGQEINVGDRVIWFSSYGAYGQMRVYIVRGITAKRVAISEVERLERYPESVPSYAAHNVVLVVNDILDKQEGE